MIVLWLDDSRDPKNYNLSPYNPDKIVWVRSGEEFKEYIENNNIPDLICFDHDLGEGMNGKDCANFLVNYCMEKGLKLPQYISQSSNPVGKENIIKYLDQAKEYL